MTKTYVLLTTDDYHALLVKLHDAKIRLQQVMENDDQLKYTDPEDGQTRSLFYPLSQIQEKLDYMEQLLKEE